MVDSRHFYLQNGYLHGVLLVASQGVQVASKKLVQDSGPPRPSLSSHAPPVIVCARVPGMVTVRTTVPKLSSTENLLALADLTHHTSR
jgi:hypothetical protein